MSMKPRYTFTLLFVLLGAAFSMAATVDNSNALKTIHDKVNQPGSDLETIPVFVVLVYLLQTTLSFFRYDMVYFALDALPVALFIPQWMTANTKAEDPKSWHGFMQDIGVSITAMAYYLALNLFPPAFVQGTVLVYFNNFRTASSDVAETELLNNLWKGALIIKGLYIVTLNFIMYQYDWDIFYYARKPSYERLQAILKSISNISGLMNMFAGFFAPATPMFYMIMSMSFRPDLM